jgi:hypothetical protein
MAEDIPSEDAVSRMIDSPEKWSPEEKKFIDERVFLFKTPDEVESVVWRKYAPEIADVHAIGCARQAEKRLNEAHSSWTYEGAASAAVSAIRSIQNIKGDHLEVSHAPDEGIHHAHLELRFLAGNDFRKQRKADLKEAVRNLFSVMEAHRCP